MTVSPLQRMLGKRLLAGITYLDEDGAVRAHVQLAGTVTAVEPLVSIVRDDGTEPFTLPPVEEAFEPAPGEYRLRSTGGVVVDPDFTTSWRVVPPAVDEGLPPMSDRRTTRRPG